MHTNKILAKVKAGENAVGLQIPFCSPDLVELMGMTGIDYVFVDCEHGSFSLSDVETMCRAAELAGITPIVRVVDVEPSTILRFIVRGAMGIIGPQYKNQGSGRATRESMPFLTPGYAQLRQCPRRLLRHPRPSQ